MKEFFKSGSFKMLLSVIFVLIMLSVFTNSIKDNFISSSVSYATYGLSKVTAAATSDATKKSYDELLKENEQLKKENASLRAQVVDYYSAKSENARLWKFYDLKKENPGYSLVPALVLRRDANDDFYSFTLDKGSTSSVSINDPVVSDNGLVGWVSAVDASTCKVVTVLSPQTSVGAVDAASFDPGIVKGSAKYCDDNKTCFAKLSSDNKVKEGDIITTTGISGLYPSGLIIGEVTQVCYDTYDTSYYAIIEPYENIKTVTELAIITDFTGQGEVVTRAATGKE